MPRASSQAPERGTWIEDRIVRSSPQSSDNQTDLAANRPSLGAVEAGVAGRNLGSCGEPPSLTCSSSASRSWLCSRRPPAHGPVTLPPHRHCRGHSGRSSSVEAPPSPRQLCAATALRGSTPFSRARGCSRRSAASLRRRASGARLLHLRSRAAKPAACRALKRRYGRCVLTAPSLNGRASGSPGRAAVSLVVVRLGNLGELQSLSGRSRGRILAVGRLDGAAVRHERVDRGRRAGDERSAARSRRLRLQRPPRSRCAAFRRRSCVSPRVPSHRHLRRLHHHRHLRHRHRHRRHRRHRRHPPRPGSSAPTPSTRARAARPPMPRATATTARSAAPAGRPRAATAPPSRWTAPATGSRSPMRARST